MPRLMLSSLLASAIPAAAFAQVYSAPPQAPSPDIAGATAAHHRGAGGGHRQPIRHSGRSGRPTGHRPHPAADPPGPGDGRRRHPGPHAWRGRHPQRRPGRGHLAWHPRRRFRPDRGADRRGEGQRRLGRRNGLRLRQSAYRRCLAHRGAARAAIHPLRQRGDRGRGEHRHQRRHQAAAGRRPGRRRLLRHGLCPRRDRRQGRSGHLPARRLLRLQRQRLVLRPGVRWTRGRRLPHRRRLGPVHLRHHPDVQFDERAYYTFSRNEFDGYDTPSTGFFGFGDDAEFGRTSRWWTIRG